MRASRDVRDLKYSEAEKLLAHFFAHSSARKASPEDIQAILKQSFPAIKSVISIVPSHQAHDFLVKRKLMFSCQMGNTANCDFNYLPDENVLHIEHITPTPPGTGAGVVALKNIVALGKKLKVDKITTNAQEVGSYVWARCGFAPTQEEWDAMKPVLRERLDRLEEVHHKRRATLTKLIESSNPKSIWTLAEAEKHIGYTLLADYVGIDKATGEEKEGWDGALDLSDRAAMRKFNAYTKGRERVFLANQETGRQI